MTETNSFWVFFYPYFSEGYTTNEWKKRRNIKLFSPDISLRGTSQIKGRVEGSVVNDGCLRLHRSVCTVTCRLSFPSCLSVSRPLRLQILGAGGSGAGITGEPRFLWIYIHTAVWTVCRCCVSVFTCEWNAWPRKGKLLVADFRELRHKSDRAVSIDGPELALEDLASQLMGDWLDY